METTNKGILSIETDNDNQKRVIFYPIKGTVWLSKCELTELFGVYRQTINAYITVILKTEIFNLEEVCKCHLIAGTGKNRIKYAPYLFSLEFIIALAFRIDSENAGILRKWIINRLLIPESVMLQIPIADFQNYQWN